MGYPETFSPTQHYNSAVLVSPAGNILTNYRKHFLFTTDKSWALPGPSGFYTTNIPTIGRTAIGICTPPPTPTPRIAEC